MPSRDPQANLKVLPMKSAEERRFWQDELLSQGSLGHMEGRTEAISEHENTKV